MSAIISRIARSSLLLAALAAFTAAPARAQSPEQFYSGRTITFIVGYGSGASYDVGARMMARHMSRHIPGKPSVVVQNMPGAGSMSAANQLANASAKDGSVIGMIGRGLYLEALFENPAVKFDPLKLNWIGSHGREVSVLVTGKDTGFRTVEDIRSREIIIGASAPGADTHVFALVLRHLLDAKVKIVAGFPGQAQAFLAMDRGEVHANAGATIGTLMALRPQWLTEKGHANFVVQLATEKHPTLLQGVPLIMDFARNDVDRGAMELAFARQSIAYAYFAPPGVPADRLEALRAGFWGAVKDPELQAEAQKLNVDLAPAGGDEILKVIQRAYTMKPEVLARAKAVLTAKE
jgi:tripartite-type tricarboxylate transporter receptor subunit TctC